MIHLTIDKIKLELKNIAQEYFISNNNKNSDY